MHSDMGHFVIYSLVFSLLITEGYFITIEPAPGVTKTNDVGNIVELAMNENNHNFTIETAILKIKDASSEPLIDGSLSTTMFRNEVRKDNGSTKDYTLYSKQSFDYEQEQRFYRFSVRVGNDFQTVDLNIINIDDESPSLSAPQCTFNENTVYTLENSTCTCTLVDPDGWLQYTTFEIKDESAAKIFDMGFRDVLANTTTSANVSIYLKDNLQLDYEEITFYMFNIGAKDGASHPTIPETVTAIIHVGDMRDTAPVWTSMIAFEQFKEQEKQTFTVSARDGDVGINKKIEYNVISQTDEDASYVSIDKTSGIISVKPIDRDAKDLMVYNLEVSAYVFDEPEWNTTASISFYIIDIDNNPPLINWIEDYGGNNVTFDKTTTKNTSLTFKENYQGSLNTTIFIQDIDTGENAQFTVELEKLSKSKIDYTQAFMIVPTVGYRSGLFQISVRNSTWLDYEVADWRDIQFNLVNMTEDSGGPGDPQKSKTTTTPEPLTIKTYDRLDTPPYIIIVESTDKNIGSLHPMKVGRILRNSGVGGIDKITRKERNKIGIEFINHITANNFTRNGVLQEQEWEAYIPITLVSCKGIIRDVDLDADMDNIAKYAKSACKILAARRLNKREHNKTKDTVEYVPDDKVLLTVQVYKSPVLQCTNCLRYGHTKKQCRSKIRCPKCTEEHEETECQKQVPKCIYCGLEHTALDRNCKERERQKKIKEIIAYNNKSYYEAYAMVPTLLSKKKVEFTGNVTDFPQLITNQNSTITVEERYA
ncbi:hypothetical protein JTB14_034867 [Gonioctena quinquepunctata]|nr:hypothetical protein JTB14_034867 [Gonioctena quinquepunctata]